MLMNFSKLLSSRKALLRQAYLANLAFSFSTIRRLAERVGHARLGTRVLLRPTSLTDEIRPASLAALDGNQSVIEEHFSDEDILQLADAIEFALEGPFAEIEIKLDELALKYAAPLRAALDRAGIVVDESETVEGQTSRIEES
jgi:hypothetical protein